MEPLILWGWDPASKQWRPLAVDGSGQLKIASIALGAARIEDADDDTYLTVEKSPDRDHIEGFVRGVQVLDFQTEGVLSLPRQSSSRMYLSSNQSIPNATATRLNLDTESYDDQDELDLANHRWTAKVAGKYLAIFKVGWYYNPIVDQRSFSHYLYKNGLPFSDGGLHSGMTNGGLGVHGTAIVNIAVNDYLEVYAKHWMGSSAVVEGSTAATFLEVIKLA